MTDDCGGFEDRLPVVEETLLLIERKLGIERPRFVAVAMPDTPEDAFDEAQRIMLEEGSVKDSCERREERDTRPEAGANDEAIGVAQGVAEDPRFHEFASD